MTPRQGYPGPCIKLLLAFDVGTTYSTISYSILEPGEKPYILRVNRFPGPAGGTAKLPSILYYSRDGLVRAVGAEAEGEGIEILAEEEDWVKVEWFKLHLRPRSSVFESVTGFVPPLPPGKTVAEVLSDFLKYLNACAKQYIEDVHPDVGNDVWSGPEIHYILTHPNGWGGPQHTLMKQAAENAGLVARQGRNQLSFISEGEASLNCGIENELFTASSDQGISIVDAGEGTIEISAYARKGKSDIFEEIAESQCHLRGSAFVSQAAKIFLQNYLKPSRFYEDIPVMIRKFNNLTKCTFRDSSDPCYIRFGSVGDQDPKFNIIAGRLRLEGTVVASFFEPSIKCIVDGVSDQCSIAHKPISHVLLVGRFVDNDYLYKRVKDDLEPRGLRVCRLPYSNIDVADGAISSVLNGLYRSRVTHYCLGVKTFTRYNKRLSEHRRRKQKCRQLPSGCLAIPDTFNVIIERNVQVSETQEFRLRFSHKSTERAGLVRLEEDIICYRGDLNADECQYMDNDPENYHKLCTVKAYLGHIPMPLYSVANASYYEIEVDIVLLLGVTDLRAQIAWIEKREEKRGPAQIIYDANL